MKSFAIIAAACVVASAAVPATAATIEQGTTDADGFPLHGFDSALGTLQNVYLHVQFQKYRGWRLDTPLGSDPLRTVSWSVNGTYSAPYVGPVTLYGYGSSSVEMAPSEFLGRNYGYFTVSVSGSGDFQLDPSLFLDRPFVFLDGLDPGYFDVTGADTTFVLDPDAHVSRRQGQCFGPNNAFSEDDCGYASFHLTYLYDPAIPAGTAPEPATWTMMIAGFGAIGGALRRRRVVTATVGLGPGLISTNGRWRRG